MATLTGRIRRISLDAGSPVNYTVQQTADYAAAAPAATVSSWGSSGDVALLDQRVDDADATGITRQGALLTFQRDVYLFTGVVVKIEPTYDFANGESPSLELWTHDSVADAWTLRRRVALASGFVGVPSGQKKFFEFFLAVPLFNVDQIWVTLAPGPVGAPTVDFYALHPFGQCRLIPKTEASCASDPTIDCIDPEEPRLTPSGPLPPILDCDDFDPDVCSIPKWEWPTLPPGQGGKPPKYTPPEFPAIDLCDPDELAAFKTLLTDEQLEYLMELMNGSELPCLDPADGEVPQIAPLNEDPAQPGTPLLPRQPVERYFDPETGEPADDPRSEQGGGGDSEATLSFPFFFFYSAEDKTSFEADLASESTEIQEQYALALANSAVEVFGAGEPQGEPQTVGIEKIEFLMANIPPGTLVGVRAMAKYPTRRSVPFTDGDGGVGEYHAYLAGSHPFAVYVEGPCITENGYVKNGWAALDESLWLPSETTLNGHKVYRKTGEDILTLRPAASTRINEAGTGDPFGRVTHVFDISDYAALFNEINIRQDGFMRANVFCGRTIAGDTKVWISQEFQYALYVHFELRPGFAPLASTPGSITAVVTVEGTSVGDQAVAANTAAALAVGHPPADFIDDYLRNNCPFS